MSGRAFALDFGADFHSKLNGRPVRLGFTVQNLGTTLSYSGGDLNENVPRDTTGSGEPVSGQLKTKSFSLPTVFQVALAYDLISSASQNNKLTLIGSFNQANSNRAGFGFASEWTTRHLGGSGFGAALRGSYSWAPANNIDLTGTVPTALMTKRTCRVPRAAVGCSTRPPASCSVWTTRSSTWAFWEAPTS